MHRPLLSLSHFPHIFCHIISPFIDITSNMSSQVITIEDSSDSGSNTTRNEYKQPRRISFVGYPGLAVNEGHVCHSKKTSRRFSASSNPDDIIQDFEFHEATKQQKRISFVGFPGIPVTEEDLLALDDVKKVPFANKKSKSKSKKRMSLVKAFAGIHHS